MYFSPVSFVIFLHFVLVVQADINDNTIYSNYHYPYPYDMSNLVMSDDCKKVDAFLQMVALKAQDNFYVANVIVGGISGYTGFDPRIRSKREELACDIASVTSFHDVSIIVHLPETYVKDIHKQLTDTWSKIGGVQGVREQYTASVMIANWVADTDYPNVPLDESYDGVREFIEEIKHLARHSVLELMDTPAFPILSSPDDLASAMSDSKSKTELAASLNTTLEEIILFENERNYYYQKASGLEVHLKAAILIEELGFLPKVK